MLTESFIKKIIRRGLEGTMSGQDAALFKAAGLKYTPDRLLELEMELLREMVRENPISIAGLEAIDAASIIRRAAKPTVTRNYSLLKRCAYISAGAAAAFILAFVTRDMVQWLMAPPREHAYETWILAEDRFPVSAFASTVQYGDSISIPVLPSSKGRLGRIGNTELWRRHNGELELVRVPVLQQVPKSEKDIVIATGAQQQCVVRLPDGIYVRLDAGSRLIYKAESAAKAKTIIGLEGQALVDVGQRLGRRPQTVVLETPNGSLATRQAEYTVVANRNDLRVTLLDGKVDGDFPIEQGQRTLKRRGDRVSYDRCCMDEDGATRMVLSDVEQADPKQSVDWMAKSWRYENVSLRAFTLEVLGRKFNLGIESVNCIPEHLTITAEIHFQDAVEVVYDHIRKAGVTFHERGGMISFCAPEFKPMELTPPTLLQNPSQPLEVLERIRSRELLAMVEEETGCCTGSFIHP